MPSVPFRHVALGVLSGEEGLWSGGARQRGREIAFVVAGTESEPDARLLDALPGVLTRLPDLEPVALAFLCVPEAPVEASQFTLESVNLLWPQRPDRFTLEFTLEGDPGAIWRVEFTDGRPLYSGRDD
jgi:hypothetical protein